MANPAPSAYPTWVPKTTPNQQGTAGLDARLDPVANWTQLEYWGADGKPYLKEYEGRGLLQDKKVLITGGDSGIGRSVAILMAREGADITFVYLEEEEEDAQYTKKEIEAAGRTCHKLALNLREEANCKKAVDEHVQKFGRIDVLVNNSE
jgi:predicted ATP-dependent serine protease